MKIWDEGLLMNSGGSQPSTDGLLFWMDGRDTLYGTEIGSYTPPAYKPAYMFDRVSNARINFTEMWAANGVTQESPFVSIVTLPDKSGGQGLVETSSVSNVLSVEVVFYGSSLGSGLFEKDNSGRFYYPYITGGAVRTNVIDYTTKPVHLIGTTDENGYPVIYKNGVKANVTSSSTVLQPRSINRLAMAYPPPLNIGCVQPKIDGERNTSKLQL